MLWAVVVSLVTTTPTMAMAATTTSAVTTTQEAISPRSSPRSGVIFDSSGNLYGTTVYGGADNAGAVYELTHSGSGWVESILYSSGTEGDLPVGGLVMDRAGNLYGSTALGGSYGDGTIFELAPSGGNWTFTLLHTFTGDVGPEDSLTMDAAGNLYGTTFTDGLYDAGSVLKLMPGSGGWTYVDLYDFHDAGNFPSGNVILDSSGNLYGTAGW